MPEITGEPQGKELPPSQRLTLLTKYLVSEVKPTINEGEFKKMPGGWVPLWFIETETRVPALFETFSYLKQQIGPQATLLECGAGLGFIGDIANIAGFSVANVELDPEKYAESLEHQSVLKQRGIVNDQIQHLRGSYYLPEEFDRAVTAYMPQEPLIDTRESKINYLRAGSSLGFKVARERILDVKQLEQIPVAEIQEGISTRIKELKDQTATLSEAGLVRSDGSLSVQVVFGFLSDPLAEYGFAEQFGSRLDEGAFLVLVDTSLVSSLENAGKLPPVSHGKQKSIEQKGIHIARADEGQTMHGFASFAEITVPSSSMVLKVWQRKGPPQAS